MLEYNADTPSLQLESGPVSAEWARDKYGSSKRQNNNIETAYKDVFRKLKTTCAKMGVVTTSEDDENTAVMQWFKSLISSQGINVVYSDIKNLKE